VQGGPLEVRPFVVWGHNRPIPCLYPPECRSAPTKSSRSSGPVAWGEVYRARDTRLDRTVAIKVLPEALAADPQLRERFDREARAISSLNHPHICALYDVGHHPRRAQGRGLTFSYSNTSRPDACRAAGERRRRRPHGTPCRHRMR
jgi:hypothetical protein